MKKNVILSMLIVSLVFLVTGCGKAGNDGDENYGQQIVDAFNKAPIGVTIKVAPADIVTNAVENNRYVITFKNPDIIFDTKVYEAFSMGDQIKAMKIPIPVKELTYLYGPKEKFLKMIEMKGMDFTWDASKLMVPGNKSELKGFPQMNLKMTVGKMTSENYNISAIMNSKHKNIMEFIGQLMKDNRENVSTLEKMTYQFDFPIKEDKSFSVLLKAEKIKMLQDIAAEVFVALYKKDAPTPDFEKVLKENASLFGVDAHCSGVELIIKEGGELVGSGSIAEASFGYFLKANAAKTAFNFESTGQLKNLQLVAPKSRDAEILAAVKELKAKTSIENLSPAFAAAYFEFTKKSMTLTPNTDPEKIKQQQMIMGMNIGTAFVSSKPIIHISISPLDHSLGKLDIDGKFQFHGMSVPAGKATVKIAKINELLKNLKENKLLTIGSIIAGAIENITVIDDNGDGSITFETKQDKPGKYFLNGVPMNMGK
ncbi:MAG: hypothetical protein GY757_61220 [bacterium]|nr:hypothetical protein [bacterium]